MLKLIFSYSHRKGVGSTKNGRDSESKRLGVKRADGQAVTGGRSWFANAERKFIQARTWVSVKTILCLRKLTAL